MEFSKWGVEGLDVEVDLSSLSPLQPLILKSHGYIHCGQIPMPVHQESSRPLPPLIHLLIHSSLY